MDSNRLPGMQMSVKVFYGITITCQALYPRDGKVCEKQCQHSVRRG